MAFDMGFDFRATAGFVTDPAYGVPVLAEAFPHTYTAGNGNSINAGWSVAPGGSQDRTNTNDARIAGDNFTNNVGVPSVFTVDLSSGSNPGAGTYTIDLAMGDSQAGRVGDFKVKDNTTVLIDGTNGGSGFTTNTGHFIDATLTDVAASVTWTGTAVSKTFSSTTAHLENGTLNNSLFTLMAHFRLTQSATSIGSLGLFTLMGVGV